MRGGEIGGEVKEERADPAGSASPPSQVTSKRLFEWLGRVELRAGVRAETPRLA